MECDADGSGEIDKDEFLAYFQSQPHLRVIIAEQGVKHCASSADQASGNSVKTDPRLAYAIEMKRMLKVLRKLDVDGNGTLDYNEFLDFFRQAGYLIEYAQANPRDELQDIMAKLQDVGDEKEENKLVAELEYLGKKTLNIQQRRKSEMLINRSIDEDLPEKNGVKMVRRRSCNLGGLDVPSPDQHKNLMRRRTIQ